MIGCGNIAQVHCQALQQLASVELIAFADCKREKAENMSQKYAQGKAGVYENYIDLLEQEKPEAVHICTPHYLHVPMALEALKRNIAVFMEKPPAISREEFEELTQAVRQTKARIGFCFQNRYNATTIELDRIVEQKKLGNVIGGRGFVTWKRDADYYSDEWHGSLQKEGGGVLINQSIHTLDLLLRYLGTPKTVMASMHNYHLDGITEVEDTLEAWMEFDDGKRANFYAATTYATDAPVILELAFENGRVTMIDRILQIHENGSDIKCVSCELPGNSIGKSYWGRGHLACIEDFYRCLYEGKPYGNDLEGVANTLYTTMRIYEDAGKRKEREERK